MQSTHCTSWRSGDLPPCLGGSSHRWVPVNTRCTPVPLRREAVGGSAPTASTTQDISSQEFRQTWWRNNGCVEFLSSLLDSDGRVPQRVRLIAVGRRKQLCPFGRILEKPFEANKTTFEHTVASMRVPYVSAAMLTINPDRVEIVSITIPELSVILIPGDSQRRKSSLRKL